MVVLHGSEAVIVVAVVVVVVVAAVAVAVAARMVVVVVVVAAVAVEVVSGGTSNNSSTHRDVVIPSLDIEANIARRYRCEVLLDLCTSVSVPSELLALVNSHPRGTVPAS